MVQEETLIAEKIIKPFPNEKIVLDKKFNNRKSDIWFKNHNLAIEVDEGNHENYDKDDEKEREESLNSIISKLLDVIQMILTLIFLIL